MLAVVAVVGPRVARTARSVAWSVSFVCEDGATFKASVQHFPYFYILLAPSATSTSTTASSSTTAASAHSDYLEPSPTSCAATRDCCCRVSRWRWRT